MGLLLAGCSTFGSGGQQSSFNKLSNELKRIHQGKEPLVATVDGTSGVLVVFDTNEKKPVPISSAKGDSASTAMHDLLRSNSDPCSVSGPKPAIAAFAPPQTVDLPYVFTQCSELRDEVKMVASQTRALSRLTVATKGNNASLDRLAKDIAAVADAQDMSWEQVTAMLAEMSGRPKASGAGN